MQIGTLVAVVEPECPAFGKIGTVMRYLPGIGVKVYIPTETVDEDLTEEQKDKVSHWGSVEYVRALTNNELLNSNN